MTLHWRRGITGKLGEGGGVVGPPTAHMGSKVPARPWLSPPLGPLPSLPASGSRPPAPPAPAASPGRGTPRCVGRGYPEVLLCFGRLLLCFGGLRGIPPPWCQTSDFFAVIFVTTVQGSVGQGHSVIFGFILDHLGGGGSGMHVKGRAGIGSTLARPTSNTPGRETSLVTQPGGGYNFVSALQAQLAFRFIIPRNNHTLHPSASRERARPKPPLPHGWDGFPPQLSAFKNKKN